MGLSLAIGLVLIALWTLGLWKALEWWSPRSSVADRIQESSEHASSIIPRTFWICCVLLTLAAIARWTWPGDPFRPIWVGLFVLGTSGIIVLNIRVEITAMSDPRLILLSRKHHLKTDEGHENVLRWARAHWFFEKPASIVCTAGVLLVGAILSLFDSRFIFVGLGSFVTLYGLWGICRYTTLFVRSDGIILQRWFSSSPTRRIPLSEIDRCQVDQPLSHHRFRVFRLTLFGSKTVSIAVKDPEPIVKAIGQLSS